MSTTESIVVHPKIEDDRKLRHSKQATLPDPGGPRTLGPVVTQEESRYTVHSRIILSHRCVATVTRNTPALFRQDIAIALGASSLWAR